MMLASDLMPLARSSAPFSRPAPPYRWRKARY